MNRDPLIRVVYVAGPYTKPDPIRNVRTACGFGDELLREGFIPLIPHLSQLWHTVSPKSYETWMDIDFALLERCDAVLRIPGESKGADREVVHAGRLGVPVFHSIDALIEAREEAA